MIENIQNNFPQPYINAQYQPGKFETFKAHVNRLDKAAAKNNELTNEVFAVLSPIIPVRRISSLPDNIKDGNYARAAGLVGLMAVNLPEDSRDIGAAVKQVCKNQMPTWYKEFQTPFSFFRGTFLEPVVNKMGKYGAKLHEADVSLYETKFGELCQKVFKFDIADFQSTKRFVPRAVVDDSGKIATEYFEVYASKVEGSTIGKLVGNALLRIPYFSTLVMAGLEMPAIVKAFRKPAKNAKETAINGSSQIVKSSVNVSAILTGIGVFGALLKGRGPVGSLIGMGLGSVAGAHASKKIGEKIDSVVDKLKS